MVVLVLKIILITNDSLIGWLITWAKNPSLLASCEYLRKLLGTLIPVGCRK